MIGFESIWELADTAYSYSWQTCFQMVVILKNAVLQIPTLLILVKKGILKHLGISYENVENQYVVYISEVSRENIQIMYINF